MRTVIAGGGMVGLTLARLLRSYGEEPGVLEREGLRPSRVATHERAITQAGAAGVFGRNPAAIGLRWWSTLEALWANVTLFDRAETLLAVEDVQPLELGDDVVVQAAEFLGLSIDLT